MSQLQMITCPNCGTPNRATARFCGSCRTPLEVSEQKTLPLPPAPPTSPETIRLPDESKTPFAERTTRRLDEVASFAALPDGAIIGKYEVRQTFPAQPGINSYLIADAQSQFSVMFEAENVEQWASEKHLFDARIEHPAIAKLVDVFEQVQYENQPRAYLVTEYPMSPLAQIGALGEYDLLAWSAQLAQGLAFLHDHNLAHSNIQASSIVVTGNKQVKLWNLANVRPLTPELRAWDVYQLAYTLYQAAIPAERQAPTLSPTTTQVFARARAQDARQRYQDARAFASDLDNALNALRRPEGVTLVVGRMTDVGQKRELNEDALLTIDLAQFVQQGSQAIGLFVVADGMGGAAAGEVASKMVTDAITRHVLANTFAQHVAAQPANLDYGAIIKGAVEQANRDVFQTRSAAHNDMGSTMVAALVVGNQAYIVNVGDSRAYLIAPDRIEKITKDHSLVQAFVDRNEIGEDDVYTHPQRNFILRNVGDKAQVQTDLYTRAFEPGQYLLLCSDGLWEMVYPKNRLHEIVTNAPSAQEACKRLIDAANKNGGDDNITVVLVKFEKV